MNCETRSLRRSFPSSSIIITATAVIGFDIDARRKIVSRAIGFFASMSMRPCASKWAIRPRRATSVTAPETSRASMCRCTASWIRCSRSAEKPTSSGLAVGTDGAAASRSVKRIMNTNPTRASRMAAS
jgi:hypothetical protein